MTAKQQMLLNAITWRLSEMTSYNDLLVAAAREAGMTRLEAIIELDKITAQTEKARARA